MFYISEEDKTIVNNFFKNEKIEGKKTCIHIRRGDYLKYSDFHNVCNLDYYLKAISTIGDGSFIFVSDDIKWVKENFKSENYDNYVLKEKFDSPHNRTIDEIKKDSYVLDIGCYSAKLAKILNDNKNCKVTLIDKSKKLENISFI